MGLTAPSIKRLPVTTASVHLGVGLSVGPTGLDLFHFNCGHDAMHFSGNVGFLDPETPVLVLIDCRVRLSLCQGADSRLLSLCSTLHAPRSTLHAPRSTPTSRSGKRRTRHSMVTRGTVAIRPEAGGRLECSGWTRWCLVDQSRTAAGVCGLSGRPGGAPDVSFQFALRGR